MEEKKEFTFLTYNLDCQNYNFEERLRSFLDEIKENPPDVVVIQEGTRLSYEKLLREMGLLGYKRQLLDVMNSRATGEIIFSKFPISSGDYLSFKKSSERRGISYLKLDIWGIDNIWICTSQFDNTNALSRTQIKTLNTVLKKIPERDNIIFGGDTRISEYQGDLSCPDGWYDSWYEAGNDKEKYTYDSETNFLVKPPYKDRPDRIWYRPSTKGNRIECIDCKLYGHDSPKTISSHYGVWAKFLIS